MKNTLAILFLLFVPLFAWGQLSVKKYAVGNRMDTGEPVYADVYSGAEEFRSWQVYDGGGKALISMSGRKSNGKFKKKGTLACYDLDDGSQIWSKQLNHKWHNVHYYDSLVVVDDSGSRLVKSYYDPLTGELLHESSDVLLGMLPDGNMLRWNLMGGRGRIFSVSPDGSPSWDIAYDGDEAPVDHYMADDTTLVIIAAGLHIINPSKGKGWHYQSKISTGNGNALRSARALRFNNYEVNYYAGNMVWSVYPVSPTVEGMYSNAHREENFIYWASADKISCLDAGTGEPRWEVALDINESSAGKVLFIDGKLYHFNYGAVQSGPHNYRCGEPYIAVYNPADGELVSCTPTGRILSFLVDTDNGQIHILTPEGVYPYYVEAGIIGEELRFEALGTEFIPYFVREDAMIAEERGERFRYLYQSYPADSFALALSGVKCWIVSGNGMVVADEVEWSRIMVPQRATTGHIVAANAGTTRFYNIAQENTAEIKAGYNANHVGRYMFWNYGRNLFRVDLSPLLDADSGQGNPLDFGNDPDERIIIY